jgi:Ricin-type beta-trefoil lectin domain
MVSRTRTRTARRVALAVGAALTAGVALGAPAHADPGSGLFQLRNTAFNTCAQVDGSVQANPKLKHRLGLTGCDNSEGGQLFLLGADGTIRSFAYPDECVTFLPNEWVGRDFLAARPCATGNANQQWAYGPITAAGRQIHLMNGTNVFMEGLRPDGPIRPTTKAKGAAQVWDLAQI